MVSGRISPAYSSSRYSLRRLYPESLDKHSLHKAENLTDFEKRLKLSRRNTEYLIRQKVIGLHQCGSHQWKVFIVPGCEEFIKDYILYRRRNHPSKKGCRRISPSLSTIEKMNLDLYPQGIILHPELL